MADTPTPIVCFDEIDSTSSEAMRRVLAGAAGPLWVRANVQTRGRGRSGRAWTSPAGNLYATLMFAPECSAAEVPQLSLLAGVAVFDSIGKAGDLPGLRLKWPNDVLIGAGKVAGILAESSIGPGGGTMALLGIGINLASAPEAAGGAATHLSAQGVRITPQGALAALDTELRHWLAVWDRGKGFAAIRAAWLERGGVLGERVTINAGSTAVAGRFAGLDAAGALLLEDPDGGVRRFTFGDVALAPGSARA